MQAALEEARQAGARGEVPVGAVLVIGDEIHGRSGNQKEAEKDPLGHAEILAIREAAKALGRWRLSDATLYVTLEPCLMCAGAIVQARVGRIVFGTKDPKAGAVVSLYETLSDTRLNHRPEVVSGILADECAELLKNFFQGLRKQAKEES